MKKLLVFIAAFFLTLPAFAAQNATQLPTTSPYPGLTMLANINSAFTTFQTNFSGASAPSSPILGQWFVNTSNNLLEFYNGSAWVNVAYYSSTQWVPISNGVIQTIPASTGSSNAYTVNYSPAATQIVIGQHYPFIANFQNTSAATENVNGIGAYSITKKGAVALVSNDIPNGAVVDTVWDGTEFQMTSQLGNSASGTVTSIATNNGVTGGTITTSGTIGLANINNLDVLANTSGGSSNPTDTTVSSLLDNNFGSTQGGIIYRGSSGWAFLSPGTNGKPLLTGGAGANPSWGNLPTSALNGGSGASSSTFWRGDGTWAAGGLAGCTQVHTTYVNGGGGTQSDLTATCSGGYVLTGGSCYWGTCLGGGCAYPSATTLFFQQAGPTSSTSWYCNGYNNTENNATENAIAFCCH